MLSPLTEPQQSRIFSLLPALPLDCALPALRLGAQAFQWRAAGNSWSDISRNQFPDMATAQLIDLATFALRFVPEWRPFEATAEAFRASFDAWQWGLRALPARGEKPTHTVLRVQEGAEARLCACRCAIGKPLEAAELSTSSCFDLSNNRGWDRLAAFEDLLRAAIAVRHQAQ